VDWELIVVFVCGILSFLFSASETALTSLGRLEVQALMARGGSSVKLIQSWVRDPNRYLITVLVGNNIVNIAASSIFALWVSHEYPNAEILLIAFFTLLVILFAEIIPKLLARSITLQVAPGAVRFLRFVEIVLKPVIFVTSRISTGIVMVSGMPGREVRQPISEEELTHTIEIAAKEGGIDRETGEVLANLIDFPDIKARDVMTHRSRVQALNVRWSQEEVLRFIASDGHSRYPVIRNSLDEIVGILLVKDLLNHLQKASGGSWTRVIRKPYFISEISNLGTILRDMRRWGTHLAMVRDESGLLVGLVTLEDLIEEIVGDIRDEHDDPVDSGDSNAMGGPKLVSGEMAILDFNHRFNAALPLDASYSTLNGYLLAKTGGQLPPVATLIFAEDITFRVHSVSDAGIATLELVEVEQSSGD
jgi:putative hemolysin